MNASVMMLPATAEVIATSLTAPNGVAAIGSLRRAQV